MTDISAIILDRSTRWMQAWVDQDRAVLEDSLAPDYALIVSAMPERRMDRALWLATCDAYRCTSFRYRDAQVRELSPGMAVMSSIAEQQAAMNGIDRSGAFFLTDVWRLEMKYGALRYGMGPPPCCDRCIMKADASPPGFCLPAGSTPRAFLHAPIWFIESWI